MSEMVMIVPVIVLTGVVLVGILSVFRKYMAQRDRLDAEFLREQAAAEKKAATAAAPLPLGSNPEPAAAILAAAGQLLPHLERGERVAAAALRAAMETAFGASDATGAWDWKTAYDACEAAAVLFLRKYGRALFRKAGSPAARLSAVSKIANLLPTHTRRSAESQTFQQFSTPIPLGLVAAHAAAITPADRVLEPSAGGWWGRWR